MEMEKEKKPDNRESKLPATNQPDVVLTPSNYGRAFIRVQYCLKEKKAVSIGVTLKNLNLFENLIDKIEGISFPIKEVSRQDYDVGGIKAKLITIKKA